VACCCSPLTCRSALTYPSTSAFADCYVLSKLGPGTVSSVFLYLWPGKLHLLPRLECNLNGPEWVYLRLRSPVSTFRGLKDHGMFHNKSNPSCASTADPALSAPAWITARECYLHLFASTERSFADRWHLSSSPCLTLRRAAECFWQILGFSINGLQRLRCVFVV
jgi:hypothetical protein